MFAALRRIVSDDDDDNDDDPQHLRQVPAVHLQHPPQPDPGPGAGRGPQPELPAETAHQHPAGAALHGLPRVLGAHQHPHPPHQVQRYRAGA